MSAAAPETLTENEIYLAASSDTTTGEVLSWEDVISAVSVPIGSRRLIRIRLQGRWPNVARTIARLYSLCDLRPGWDSYGAQSVQPEIIESVARWIPALLQPSTPEPAVVPQVRGGIQLEWHRNGIDLEIYAESPTNISFAVEDLNTGQTVEAPLSNNEGLLRSWIARISG